MNQILLCPACLAELPDDYPYDHVAIDRALTSEPERFATMTTGERRDVVLTGLTSGMSITQLANQLQCGAGRIRALLPAAHPESTVNTRIRHAAERAALDATVRTLWEQGLPDTDIALRTGRSVYVVADARRRLGLPTHPNRRVLLTGGH